MKKDFNEKFENEEYLATQSWNKKEKESNLGFYITIALVCFGIAWVMS